jgi:hypothetical protein
MRVQPRERLGIAWFALSAISLLSWWIGAKHAQGVADPSAAISLGVIAIAAIKVRVIFREFMEVRHAPVLLQRLTDAWLALMIAGLVAAYLVGGGGRLH